MEWVQLFVFLISASPLKVWSCPSDCICYKDSFNSHESWQWTKEEENDKIHDVNNEVIENVESGSVKHKFLETVTCIVRSANMSFLKQIPLNTEILSLLQSEGSGRVELKGKDLEAFRKLRGLEVKGSASEGFSLFPLDGLFSLEYLSLENIRIDTLSNELPVETPKIPPESQTSPNDPRNKIELIENKEPIVPYSVYKKKTWIKLAFNDLPSLSQLRISKCDMGQMTMDIFHNLPSLSFLLLEENELHFLPDFLFISTPSLSRLSLAKNKILSLGTVGLAGLLTLKTLDMSRNNITHLSELSLPPFPLLQTADFRFNPIETVFPNTFEVMNSTKKLLLGGPEVSLHFYPSSFAGLSSLTHLTLNNVEVPSLEKAMLGGMPNLQYLKMDGKMRKISFDAFTQVLSLEQLILKNCLMKKISMDGFVGLKSLVTLDLSNNKLTTLPPGIFDDQKSLRELYLQGNQISSVPASLLIPPPLKMVRIENNPLDCSNCDLSQLYSILHMVKRGVVEKIRNCTHEEKNCQTRQVLTERFSFEKRVSPICNFPSELKGKTVFQLIQKQLNKNCSNSTMRELKEEKISKPGKKDPPSEKPEISSPLPSSNPSPSPNTILLNRIEMKLKKLKEEESTTALAVELKNEIPIKAPLSTSFDPLSEIERVEKSLSAERRTEDETWKSGEVKLSKKAKLAKYWKLKQKLAQLRDLPLKRVAQVPL